MRTYPLIIVLVLSMLGASTGRSGGQKDTAKLPGAKGPLYEYVGKVGPKVSGADVGADINDPTPEKPPKRRELPTGTKALYIAVQFEAKPPPGSTITIDVYSQDGQVEMKGGLVLQAENNATGQYTVTLAQNPQAGKFADGPYQARAKLDDKIVALINWGVGESERGSSHDQSFKPGDQVVVVPESADLRLGAEVVTRLSKGQHLVVKSVRGQWVGCVLEVDGHQKSGWVAAQFLSSAPDARRLESVGRPSSKSATLLPAPSPLPPFPVNLGWSQEDQETLAKVVANYSQDQVSANLALEKMLEQKKDKLSAGQVEWLQKSATASHARALTVLTRDFDAAARAFDLHTMHLCLRVANRVKKDSLAEQRAALDTAKSQVIAGKRIADPVWKVTQATGQWLDDFSEGTFNRISLSPKQGDKALRVKARIENVSAVADLPYASAALTFGDFNSRKDEIKGPARIAEDDFLFLLTDDKKWIKCEYVCESCKALRGFTVVGTDRDTNRGIVICGGTYIPKGEAFDLDVVFSVPKDVANPRLFVMGSAPVPVDVAK